MNISEMKTQKEAFAVVTGSNGFRHNLICPICLPGGDETLM